MIYLDSVFSIGKEHDICEDYVFINNDTIPFIIASDGCSSSDHTDIGSRLITIQAKNYILQHYNELLHNKEYIINIFREAFIYTKSLYLSNTVLDATLLFAFIIDNELHYFCIGDGVIAYKQNDKTTILNLTYKNERVFYGNYHNNLSRFEKYNEYDLTLDIENIKIENNSRTIEKKSTKDYILYNSLNIESLDYFIMSTDGLLSCHVDEKTSKKYFLDFLSFKNLKGEFIKRRYKGWKKKINKDGINHADDIGVVGFSFFKDES
jgi:serine/threonine protein phosphatase PrpC